MTDIKTININQNIPEEKKSTVEVTIEKKQADAPAANISNLFANMGNIVLEVTEEIPEYQRVYKDEEVYRRDLENQLLNDLPISKQNSKYWQDQVAKRVNQILELKRYGQEIMDKGGVEYYRLLDEYLNHHFSQSWIIPIVLDLKKIYRKIVEDRPVDIKTPPSEYVTDSPIKDGIQLVDQKKELAEITGLTKSLKKKEIKIERYFQLLRTATYPYLYIDRLGEGKNPVGYQLHLEDYSALFRLYNANNIYWETRIGAGPDYTIGSSTSTLNNKEGGYQRRKIVKGEQVNLVGFLVLPRGVRSLYGLYPPETVDKWGKVGEIEQITKAKNSVITLRKHGLQDGVRILISGAKTKPDINGEYTIKVLDSDHFVIDANLSQGEIVDMGMVHAVLKLSFEKRWLGRVKDEIKVYADQGGKKGKEQSKFDRLDMEKAIFYQIDSFKVLPEDYQKALRLVIPTLGDILQIESGELSSEGMLKRVGETLEGYGLSLTDLSAESLEGGNWREIWKKNAEKELVEIEKQRLARKPRKKESENRNIFQDTDFLLADRHFYQPNIIKYYGDYPLKATADDSVGSRLTWLERSSDQGRYYFAFTNEKILTENKKTFLSQLETALRDLQKELKGHQATYQKEYRVDKYFDQECQKTVKEYASVDEMMEDDQKYKQGSRALVKGNPPQIYEWEKDAWKLVGETEFTDVGQLCFFGDKKIKDMKADDLKCDYDLEYGCRSRRLIRFQKRIDQSQVAINHYQEQIDALKKNIISKEIVKKLDKYLDWLELDQRSKQTVQNQAKNVAVGEKEKIILKKGDSNMAFSVVQILNKIVQVSNEANRRYLIYKLISRDGILIGNWIYSKKYESRLICGHWYFLWLQDLTDSNARKDRLHQRMLNQFGDGGRADHGYESCRICGNYLDEVAYDNVEGFDKDGHLIRHSEVLIKEVETEEMDVVVENLQFYCQSLQFKKEMENRKIVVTQNLLDICDVLHSLLLKLNLNMYKSHLTEILVDVLPYVNRLVSFEKYKRVEIVNLQKRGLPLKKINLLNERGYFTDKYQNYLAMKKYLATAVRVLITLQTAVPPYVIASPLTKCPLMGIDGEDGERFMICLLEEMDVFDQKLKKKDIETFRGNTQKHFREIYQNMVDRKQIQRLFQEREKFAEKVAVKETEEERELNELLDKYQIGELSSGQRKDPLLVLRRIRYLSLRIQDLVHKAVKASPVVNPLMIENTCCYQNVQEYGNYWNFINQEVGEIMGEIKELTVIARGFLNKGVVYRQFFPDSLTMETRNKYVFQVNAKEVGIIKGVFLKYCSTGETKGELHIWVGEGDKRECLKCKKIWRDIEENEYSLADYNGLLNSISRLNFEIITIEERYPDLVDRLMEDVNRDDLENINLLIRSFVDKLAKVMMEKTDKKFVEKYFDIISNLGNLNKVYDEKVGQLKTKEKNTEKIDIRVTQICNCKEYDRISLLKTYINDYFRKNISYIQNNVEVDKQKLDVEAMGISKGLAEELQGFIFKENEKMCKFMKKCQYFQELRFDFTIEEVNNIFGYSDRFNCARTKVIQESTFTLKEASNLLIYILVSQLNKFISNIPGGQDKKGYCQVVADFIVTILDKIYDDETYLNISEGDLKAYQLVIQHEQERPMKADIEMAEWEYTFGKYREKVEEEKAESDLNLDLVKANQEADIISKIKSDYLAKYGEEPTTDTVEDMKDKYLHDLSYEEDVLDKDYDLFQPKEGLDIMEIGDDYGELPQGMETAGDGISDFSMDVLP